MNAVDYIYDLLKDNKTVIVPGFGMFFLKNSKAQLDEATKSILPPAKQIDFNINYEAIDNGFVNWFANKSQISVSEAETEITKLTEYWKMQLLENGELNIEKLGKFIQSDTELKFFGNRLELDSPDFYGLEQIDLKNVTSKSPSQENVAYKVKKSPFWLFLFVIPVLALAYFAITQREQLFGKKSFDQKPTSKQNSLSDSLKYQKAKAEKLKLDSLKLDSLKQDSISKLVAAKNIPLKNIIPKNGANQKSE